MRQTWNLGQICRHGISYLLTCWHIEGERKTCEYEDRIIYRKRKLFRIEDKWEANPFPFDPTHFFFFFFFLTKLSFFFFWTDPRRSTIRYRSTRFFFFQFRRHPRIKRTRKRVGDRCKSIQVHSSSTTVWISLTRWMWRLLAKVSTNLRQVVRQSRYVIDSRVINGWICCVGSIARSSN